MQAMPQLTNRSLLPHIVDPVIKNTVDEKYLFQVCELQAIVYFSRRDNLYSKWAAG